MFFTATHKPLGPNCISWGPGCFIFSNEWFFSFLFSSRFKTSYIEEIIESHNEQWLQCKFWKWSFCLDEVLLIVFLFIGDVAWKYTAIRFTFLFWRKHAQAWKWFLLCMLFYSQHVRSKKTQIVETRRSATSERKSAMPKTEKKLKNITWYVCRINSLEHHKQILLLKMTPNHDVDVTWSPKKHGRS